MRIPTHLELPLGGHTHFWERAGERGITRGQFLTRSAGAVGAFAVLGAISPRLVSAQSSAPKPIPGGIPLAEIGLPVPPFPEIIHVQAPGVLTPDNSEPNTITDFNGHIGYAIIDGHGTGTDTATGETTEYNTNVDMRFMKGVYIGEDGRTRRGSFAFV